MISRSKAIDCCIVKIHIYWNNNKFCPKNKIRQELLFSKPLVLNEIKISSVAPRLLQIIIELTFFIRFFSLDKCLEVIAMKSATV